jgi:serine/threonine-protein kinase
MDLETGKLSPLVDRDVVEVRYTSGYLVYAIADGTLYASAFDASTGRVSGVPLILARGVAIGGNNTAQFAVARNGTVVYIPEEPRSLVLVDREGSIRPGTPEKRNFHAPMFSPDGRRIALDFNSPDGRDVWVLSLTDGLLSRATFDRDGHDAVWTPDGRALSYTSLRNGVMTLMRMRPGESQTPEVLLNSAQLGYGGVWIRDASALITVSNSREAGSDLAWVRGGGKGPLEPLLNSRFDEGYPAVSPDGHWLAFVSNQSGQNQVYARSLRNAGDQVQISLTGGTEPGWSRDGRELFYRTGAGLGSEFISASVGLGAVIEVKGRRTLFPVADMVTATPHRNWDVSPDGRSFVMVRFNPATRIMVIQQLGALVGRLQGAAH